MNNPEKSQISRTHQVLQTLAVVGSGGHGRVVADAAESSGIWKCVVFFDDNLAKGSSKNGWRCIGKPRDMTGPTRQFELAVVGIGNNNVRLSLSDELVGAGVAMATVLHPAAIISNQATIAAGCVVFAGAIVNIGTQVSRACIVNTGAIIDHDCNLAEGVHVSPGAVLAGGVTLGARVWVGAGATIIEGVSVGAATLVAAGATVVSDLPSGVVAMGTPARVVKTR